MTFWLLGLIVYSLIVFLAFSCVFVGGRADEEWARFLKEQERRDG